MCVFLDEKKKLVLCVCVTDLGETVADFRDGKLDVLCDLRQLFLELSVPEAKHRTHGE